MTSERHQNKITSGVGLHLRLWFLLTRTFITLSKFQTDVELSVNALAKQAGSDQKIIYLEEHMCPKSNNDTMLKSKILIAVCFL